MYIKRLPHSFAVYIARHTYFFLFLSQDETDGETSLLETDFADETDGGTSLLDRIKNDLRLTKRVCSNVPGCRGVAQQSACINYVAVLRLYANYYPRRA